jgi:hypothetical protein
LLAGTSIPNPIVIAVLSIDVGKEPIKAPLALEDVSISVVMNRDTRFEFDPAERIGTREDIVDACAMMQQRTGFFADEWTTSNGLG